MNLFTELFDFFLPRFCPACNRKLTAEEKFVCPECMVKIQSPSKERLQSEYNRKFGTDKFISGFTSLYIFEKEKELQQILHALKYNQKFLLGKFLGEKIGETFGNLFETWNINLIVPVPLHHLKKAERGYNQSYFIAKGISKTTNIKVNEKIVRRIRFTQSQTALNMEERGENVRDAFEVKNIKLIFGKNILLIDDVITTGATINECASVILNAGANTVYAASVAIAD